MKNIFLLIGKACLDFTTDHNGMGSQYWRIKIKTKSNAFIALSSRLYSLACYL